MSRMGRTMAIPEILHRGEILKKKSKKMEYLWKVMSDFIASR